MKTYLIRAGLIFSIAIMAVALMLGGEPVTTTADTDSSTQANTSIVAVTQPADPAYMAKQALLHPLYVGATPAPAKNGPFGLVKTVPLNELSTAPAPTVLWYDTQEDALAALKAIAPDSIIEGVLWEHAPPSGWSLTLYGADCNNNGAPNLGGSLNFDNITSSLDNSCGSITLHADPNYLGAQQSYPSGRTSNVGPIINDQASSVFFKP